MASWLMEPFLDVDEVQKAKDICPAAQGSFSRDSDLSFDLESDLTQST